MKYELEIMILTESISKVEIENILNEIKICKSLDSRSFK